jgi:hypothetical protein
MLGWMPVMLEAVERKADLLDADDEWDVLEVNEGKMPATAALVVSDDCEADACDVPMPPDELRIDEEAVVGCRVVGGSVDVEAGLTKPVALDAVPPAPNV